MSTYLKTLIRTFKKHITRFLSIVFIVLVSVGFISGLGGSTNKIDQSLSEYYKAQNVSDFIVKSTRDKGFTPEEIARAKEEFGEENVMTGFSLDLPCTEEKRSLRLYFLDFNEWTINVPDLVEGESYKENASPLHAYAEQADNVIKGYGVGETVGLDLSALGVPFPLTVTIKGILQSPLTFAVDGEPSYNNPENTKTPDTIAEVNKLDLLENVLYLSKELLPMLPVGDLYLTLSNRNAFNAFASGYAKVMGGEESAMSDYLKTDEIKILTLYDNYSFVSLHAYADKVMKIGVVLMVAFLLITALVVDSTMTRLMEEERSQIACLRTLGYGGFRITLKYVLFAMIATGIGGVASYFVGLGLASLIYYVFNYSFVMPPMSSDVTLWFFFVICFAIILTALITTVIAGAKKMRTQPAELLRPRPPRAGKKVFLERIPFIWNRLSFKHKSTVRNVLRFKSRFFMTLIAVAGSMGLVLAGISLFDMCLFQDFGSPAIMGLAAIIVVFAALLTASVIYTLTNINISERNREIATLMVLGYQDKEVAGYIYREIYLNTAVGIVFGYPLGALLMWFVFTIVNFGALSAVSWFVWLIAPLFVLLATALVTLILRHKIVKIDMNESLKAIE